MKQLKGVPAAPGLAVGNVRLIEEPEIGISRTVSTPRGEWALYEAACILAKEDLSEIIERANPHDAEILNFQQMVLDDKGFNTAVQEAIENGSNCAVAVETAAAKYAKKLMDTGDAYISARTVDLQDISRRVVSILNGAPKTRLTLTEPAIVLAREIMPSDLVITDKALILGFITEEGSAQGHAAIIARTMGIPAIVAVGEAFSAIVEGGTAAIDGSTGEIYANPNEATTARFLHRINLAKRRYLSLEKLKQTPCISKDGISFSMLANCSSEADIEDAVAHGAEGVGLLRSEFLFMRQEGIPNEEDQYLFYKGCLEKANGYPVTVRTFDIGADKQVAGISLPKEDNPALGLRGLRLSLAQTNLFKQQIRALLRAGVHGTLKVMFPMVAEPAEFDTAMAFIAEVKAELDAEKAPYSKDIAWGVMIETPAAALLAEEFAQKADFFSIGTNDLTQYTLAADRANTAVAPYYNTLSPAVLKLIELTVQAAEKHSCPVSVCGESAADEQIALQYARMGIRCFSIAGTSLLYVKETLMEHAINETRE